MSAIKIEENIYFVGVFDPELRVFDIVVPTKDGTTYNSYLIVGKEKKALIEACKFNFKEDHLKNIEEICPIEELDYIVLNHTEPDHSGTLPLIVDKNPNIEVIYSKTAKSFVENIINKEFNGRSVSDGDTIDLGGYTLEFFHTPFLHWPDTMFTYLREKNILFPCDFLGAHYCEYNIFNDTLENKEEAYNAFKYYYMSIMRPFKNHILKALDKIKNLKIDIICPSHGPILRENIQYYIDFYRDQAVKFNIRKNKNIATILYASAYNNTKKLAETIDRALKETGVETILIDAANEPMKKIIDSIEISKGLIIGTATINAKAPKPIFDVFANLVVLDVSGRIAGVFGSYGWSGEGVRISEDIVKTMRMKTPMPTFMVKMTPSDKDLEEAYKWGCELGISILES
ncbi:MAG: FprA family A-type flavoprotein [Deferribacterota bacterium]|nr:FprA family A-type flavoprotein [Deferribacterota bacterium]